MDDSPGNSIAEMSAGHLSLLVGEDRQIGRDRLLDALGSVEGSTAVLLATTTHPASGLDDLRRRGLDPEAIGLVDASGEGNEVSGIAQSAAVDGPGSLSALGIAVSDRLERLAHRHDRVVVGLDSITDLVEASSVPATFRFLHILKGRIRVGEAVLLATVDGGAHDEETLRTLAELFDETVENREN